MKKHYSAADFVITYRNDLGEYGYCRKCTADMQRFFSDNILRHYHSHGRYKEVRKGFTVEIG